MFERPARYMQRLMTGISHVRRIQVTVAVIAAVVLVVLIAVPKTYHAIFGGAPDRAGTHSSNSSGE